MAEVKPFEAVVAKATTQEGIIFSGGDVDVILGYETLITRAVLDAVKNTPMIQKFWTECRKIDLAATRDKGTRNEKGNWCASHELIYH